MTDPVLARSGPGGRVYPWPPDHPTNLYPSVTNILNQLAKPFLKAWGERVVAEFAVENRDSWENLADKDAIDLLKRAPYRFMTNRAAIGTAVHTAIDAWQDTRQPPTVDDLSLLPYIAQAIDFLETQVDEILHAEETIYNLSFRYAGSFDLIAKMKDGTIAVVDWKTSKAIYPEVALQLVAYARGEFIGHLDGTQTPLPKIDKGIVVHLTPEGGWTAKHTNTDDPDLFKAFTALRRMHYYREHTEPTSYFQTDKQET